MPPTNTRALKTVLESRHLLDNAGPHRKDLRVPRGVGLASSDHGVGEQASRRVNHQLSHGGGGAVGLPAEPSGEARLAWNGGGKLL